MDTRLEYFKNGAVVHYKKEIGFLDFKKVQEGAMQLSEPSSIRFWITNMEDTKLAILSEQELQLIMALDNVISDHWIPNMIHVLVANKEFQNTHSALLDGYIAFLVESKWDVKVVESLDEAFAIVKSVDPDWLSDPELTEA